MRRQNTAVIRGVFTGFLACLAACGGGAYEHQGTAERAEGGVGGYVVLGGEAVEKGDLDRAIELYSVAINHDPTRDDAYYHRAIARHLKGDIDKALEDLGDAVRVNLHNSRAWFKRGWIQHNNKADYQAALKDYTRAIEEDPNYADAWYHRGLTYQALKVFHKAVEDIATALKVQPGGWASSAQASANLEICRKQSTVEGFWDDPKPRNPR
jgi:tetratricopeptide (TPR) repeat protein